MKRLMKRAVSMLLAALMLVGVFGMTASAAPQTMKDGTVFDAEFYAAMYPDVVAVYGTKPKRLYQHYLEYGKNEGRLTVMPEEGAAAAEPETAYDKGTSTLELPASEYGNYTFTFLHGAPQTKSAWMAELIDYARIYNKTDNYIKSYPFEWDQALADAAQLKAEEWVYGRTKEKEVKEGAWKALVPSHYNWLNLIELDQDGGGSPEAIVGYWTHFAEGHYEYRDVQQEDGSYDNERVWVEGTYVHPGTHLNKIFSHNSRHIGVGHVHSYNYYNGDYWVILLTE